MNERYVALKNELPAIAKLVDLFPSTIQATVFDLLTLQFLGAAPNLGSTLVVDSDSRKASDLKSLDGVAMLDDKGDFHFTVRDIKATSQNDATKRLTYVAIRAYTELKNEKASRKQVINPILGKWRAASGNSRNFLATDAGIIRDGDLYSLDVHAVAEADEFIRQIKDPSIEGSWKPSPGGKRKTKQANQAKHEP